MSKPSGRLWLTHDNEEIFVAASPERVYELLADMPRMGEWSPECRQVEWTGGATAPAVDARFLGHNRGGPGGLMRWSRAGRVLVADPGAEFAFVTEEGGKESTLWRYRLESVDGGTTITESYEVKNLPLWARVIDIPTNRARELREGMRHTLAQLKVAAEAAMDSAGER